MRKWKKSLSLMLLTSLGLGIISVIVVACKQENKPFTYTQQLPKQYANHFVVGNFSIGNENISVKAQTDHEAIAKFDLKLLDNQQAILKRISDENQNAIMIWSEDSNNLKLNPKIVQPISFDEEGNPILNFMVNNDQFINQQVDVNFIGLDNSSTTLISTIDKFNMLSLNTKTLFNKQNKDHIYYFDSIKYGSMLIVEKKQVSKQLLKPIYHPDQILQLKDGMILIDTTKLLFKSNLKLIYTNSKNQEFEVVGKHEDNIIKFNLKSTLTTPGFYTLKAIKEIDSEQSMININLLSEYKTRYHLRKDKKLADNPSTNTSLVVSKVKFDIDSVEEKVKVDIELLNHTKVNDPDYLALVFKEVNSLSTKEVISTPVKTTDLSKTYQFEIDKLATNRAWKLYKVVKGSLEQIKNKQATSLDIYQKNDLSFKLPFSSTTIFEPQLIRDDVNGAKVAFEIISKDEPFDANMTYPVDVVYINNQSETNILKYDPTLEKWTMRVNSSYFLSPNSIKTITLKQTPAGLLGPINGHNTFDMVQSTQSWIQNPSNSTIDIPKQNHKEEIEKPINNKPFTNFPPFVEQSKKPKEVEQKELPQETISLVEKTDYTLNTGQLAEVKVKFNNLDWIDQSANHIELVFATDDNQWTVKSTQKPFLANSNNEYTFEIPFYQFYGEEKFVVNNHKFRLVGLNVLDQWYKPIQAIKFKDSSVIFDAIVEHNKFIVEDASIFYDYEDPKKNIDMFKVVVKDHAGLIKSDDEINLRLSTTTKYNGKVYFQSFSSKAKEIKGDGLNKTLVFETKVGLNREWTVNSITLKKANNHKQYNIYTEKTSDKKYKINNKVELKKVSLNSNNNELSFVIEASDPRILHSKELHFRIQEKNKKNNFIDDFITTGKDSYNDEKNIINISYFQKTNQLNKFKNKNVELVSFHFNKKDRINAFLYNILTKIEPIAQAR